MAQEAKQGEKILREKVDEYKKTHRDSLPELDFALLMKSIKRVNGSSPVKAARNALDENREWIPGTATRNVGGVFLDEKHHVTFTLRNEGGAVTVDTLMEQLEKIDKKLPLKNVPVMLKLGEDKTVQITELYTHSKVKDMWAGLPFDFVLGYVQDVPKKKKPEQDEESQE